MIETKVLSDAPGIQNQGLSDKTESTSLPAMTNGVIVGRFKRGRMDKAMVVTANNYQAVLGHDPSNPSYMALEDIFALGVGQVMVLRTGSSDKGDNSGNGSSDANDGVDTNTVNFLKFQNDQQINSNDGDVAGLVYSINGGAITAVSRSLPLFDELGGGQSFTMYEFLPVLPTGDSFLPFGRDGGFGWNDSYMPSGLDVDKFYLFGINNISWQAFFAMKDLPQPEEVTQGEFVLTIYPASKLLSANIDYDLFDLIVDPSVYTTAEITHFADQGITPATKNPDGSYTIKSQLNVVFAPYIPPTA